MTSVTLHQSLAAT